MSWGQIGLILLKTLHWWLRYGVTLFCWSVFLIAFIPRSLPLSADLWHQVSFRTSSQAFNYLTWEFDAIRLKAEQRLFGQETLLSEATRSALVRAYFADLQTAQALEAQIDTYYTDPQISNPEQASHDLQIERDSLRHSLTQRQAMIEAILEGQVAALLVEQGFGFMGQLFPPMAMHFTKMPNLLVISPRDSIERQIDDLTLYPMTIEAISALETDLDQRYDVSSLVIPLGGIALYPAMIYETASIPSAIETFAHEWLHHYLYFYPLGLSYFTGNGAEAISINETTADYFGKEIARLVLARYYPELPIPNLPTLPVNQASPTPSDPNAFDFTAEMRLTRVTVDALLAEGKVEAAESYMEERRIFFYEKGYRIRKINQAFFAFYGSYQAGGGIAGASGQDPTGAAIIAIRHASPSLYDFVVHLRELTNREQLMLLRDTLAEEQ